MARAREVDFQRDLRHAVQAGPFAQLPSADLRRFLDIGVRSELPQRTIYLREDDEVRPALVVSGLLRSSLRGPDGRQVSISYMRPGDAVGFIGLFGGALSTTIEAVGPATVLAFVPGVVVELLEKEPGAFRILAQVVTRRLCFDVGELTLHVFGTVRERVCHHLLDLAMAADPEGPLVANVTQQQIADSAGTSRESVARVLGDLEKEGLIDRSGRNIVLLEPLLMHPAHEHWQEHRMPVA